MQVWKVGGAVVAAGMMAGAARAEIRAAGAFGDHMVLQQDMPVPVWGTAAPGEKITVKFRGQEKSVVAGADGTWMVRLEPLKTGGPDELRIGDKTFADVLVGEVWFGSGQSNMGVGTGGAAKTDPHLAKIAAGDYPTIRIARSTGGWREATAKNNLSLSALPLAFAVRLQEQIKAPVGVVVGNVGGSSTEFWLTPEHLTAHAACRAAIERYARDVYPGLKARHEAEMARWEQKPADARRSPPPPPAAPGGTAMTNHIVGKLFEEHVRPAIPMAMRGVLWDQGENVSAVAGPSQSEVMHALITGWRKDWGQGEFPWVFIQKPSGAGCAWEYEDPLHLAARPFAPLPERTPGLGDGLYGEHFLRILKTPRTAMAVASDLSPGVHPPAKSAYGLRAARAALALAYGRDLPIYGPMYASHQAEGNAVRVRFDHAGKGLAARHADKLQGFMIASEDRKFVWADAAIDGASVVVSSEKVPKPTAVRYAWSQQHPWANLFNRDGLPAQPFRTDDW